MPFEIVASTMGGKKGFRVKKQGTREYYSNKPLTKEMATKQLRAIYLSEARMMKNKKTGK